MPPDNYDSLTDDEEVKDVDVMIDNGLLSDICGMVQVQANFLNGEYSNDEVEEDDDAKEEQTESRAQNEKTECMFKLLTDVEECKSKLRRWMNKIPTKNQFLEPINEEPKFIKHAKNDIVNNLPRNHPHEIFEKYVNAELKLKILEETNTYAAQKKRYNLLQYWRFRNI